MADNIRTYADAHMRQADERWQAGDALAAGRIIAEAIPVKKRPAWAARILRLALSRSGIRTGLLDEVLQIADDERLWREGHRAFSQVRRSVLELEKQERSRGLTTEQRILQGILMLAELVAKTSYNAADPSDPFDDDSAWWVAVCLKSVVSSMRPDEEFANAATAALFTQ